MFRKRFLNIAHRGARSLAPENTLAAARKAMDLGADMWELDVCMTKDGELVVLHDATLDRTSDAKAKYPTRSPWRAQDFTLTEILDLDFGAWFNREDPFGQIAGGQVSAVEAASYAGERSPTLREALAFTNEHDWLVNVEIKDLSGSPGDAVVVERVLGLVDEMGAADRALISSFNVEYLMRARRASPEIGIGLLVDRPIPNVLGLLRKVGAMSYHPRFGALKPQDIALCRSRGVAVLVWVVNDLETMGRLMKAGVGGIFTDFPQTLGALVREEQGVRGLSGAASY